MSDTPNMQGSSTEPPVFGEDMGLKPFGYYSLMDIIGAAERRLNGTRVYRNIPPFALLCASNVSPEPAVDLVEFVSQGEQYQVDLRNIPAGTTNNTGEHPGGINAPFGSQPTIPTTICPQQLMPQPEKVDLRNIPGRTIYNTGRSPCGTNAPFSSQPIPTSVYPQQLMSQPETTEDNSGPDGNTCRPRRRRKNELGNNGEAMPLGASFSLNVPPSHSDRQTTTHGSWGANNSKNKENRPL